MIRTVVFSVAHFLIYIFLTSCFDTQHVINVEYTTIYNDVFDQNILRIFQKQRDINVFVVFLMRGCISF